eukprot:131869_1
MMQQLDEVKEHLPAPNDMSLDEYKRQNEELKQKLALLERENAKLRKVLPSKKHLQTNELWKEIEDKIMSNNIDYIKLLINDKTINMFDTNKLNQTLLLLSAKHGSFEICQLCLNLGCDVNHIDSNNMTAFTYTKKK